VKPLRIIGGGPAGLSLGIALRNARVPVTVIEAFHYPRHRVCGEFVSGAGIRSLADLGIKKLLTGASVNRTTAWFAGNRLVLARPLPEPAIGLSCFELDRRLAKQFIAAGGDLRTGQRISEFTSPAESATVLACGRRADARSGWIGLKLHCRGLQVEHDLTMHFCSGGYVGISRIENESFNICGLFRLRREIAPGKDKMLTAYLKAGGLSDLAARLDAASIDPASVTATARLRFASNPWPEGVVCIGDSNTALPPFAGNGISMAFESAGIAFPLLLGFAKGERPWPEVRRLARQRLRRHFQRRLLAARLLHPLLLRPRTLPPLAWSLHRGAIPFPLAYRILR